MVFWGCSLILVVVSFLGRQVHAVPRPQGEGGQFGGQHGGQHPRPLQQHTENTERVIMATTTAAAAAAAAASPQIGGGAFPSTNQGTDSASSTSVQSTTTASPTSTPSPSSTPTFVYFESQWISLPDYKVDDGHLKQDVSYMIPAFPPPLNGNQSPFEPVLFVCQTSSADLSDLNSSNTWSVGQIPNDVEGSPIAPGVQQNSVVKLQPGSQGFTGNQAGKYFFCLANNTAYIDRFVCGSYGPVFTLEGLASNRRDLSPRQALSTVANFPTTVLSITTFSPGLNVPGATITETAPPAGTISSMTTISSSAETTTMTVTPTPTASSVPITVSSHGLSTGAKVGIALGALVLVALLLLAVLFFLRRKHRSRSPPPEQVMLTRDMHTDSFSRNALIAEKENSSRHSVANAVPADEHLPIQRHSTPSPTPYDSIPVAPYPEPASELPRRKPTNASAVSRISGPTSPRSLTVSTPPDEYEEYRDQPMPVYGDARHSPRVYSTEERQGVQAPFLTEEGMSAEEVARLEEEERRIDAAIAEAERSGRR
ncbi:hypothetical protein N431DRAFT_10053 [Stipitochalara longipes BDJ]|nr:hypothetical protein N431DRAFT_10053 [Stipitochalara longipes BDJ]